MARKKEILTKKVIEELDPIWKTSGQMLLAVQKSGEIFYANQDCLDGISMTIEELKSADVNEILPSWRQLQKKNENGHAGNKVAIELKNKEKQRVIVFQNMQRITLEDEEVFFFHQNNDPELIFSEDGNKNKFRIALEHINDPLFIWKKNGSGEIVLNFSNEAARQIFPSGELIMPGLTLGDFSRQFFEITKMIEDTFETGQKLRKEMQVEFKFTGPEKWFRSDFIKINDEFLVNLYIDISEIKQNSMKYADQERQMAILLKNLPGLAYRCRNDENWTMEFVSEGSVDLLGYHPGDLQGNRRVAYSELIIRMTARMYGSRYKPNWRKKTVSKSFIVLSHQIMKSSMSGKKDRGSF